MNPYISDGGRQVLSTTNHSLDLHQVRVIYSVWTPRSAPGVSRTETGSRMPAVPCMLLLIWFELDPKPTDEEQMTYDGGRLTARIEWSQVDYWIGNGRSFN